MVKEKKRAAIISVFAAIFLTVSKLVIGLVTGSLGILSEALHSGLDLIADVISYFSVIISDNPPDKKHNYGHGKIENFSALIETTLLLITCVWIVYEAIERLTSGKTHMEVSVWSYVVIISSIIIDINRSRMLYKVAKKHNSQALEADALHFSTDIWSSSVVLFGIICANFGFFFADSIAALVVALIVLFVSYRLGKKAINILLDKAPPEKFNLVKEVLGKTPEIINYHSIKIRTSGATTFIMFSIHVNPELSLSQVHLICEILENKIASLIDRSEILIHAEPYNLKHIQNEEYDY